MSGRPEVGRGGLSSFTAAVQLHDSVARGLGITVAMMASREARQKDGGLPTRVISARQAGAGAGRGRASATRVEEVFAALAGSWRGRGEQGLT